MKAVFAHFDAAQNNARSLHSSERRTSYTKSASADWMGTFHRFIASMTSAREGRTQVSETRAHAPH
jgi:hypothetical protein